METHKGRKPHLIIVVMQRQAPTPSHHCFSAGTDLQEAPTSILQAKTCKEAPTPINFLQAPTYRRLLPQFCKLQLARKLQLQSIFCRHQPTGGSNLSQLQLTSIKPQLDREAPTSLLFRKKTLADLPWISALFCIIFIVVHQPSYLSYLISDSSQHLYLLLLLLIFSASILHSLTSLCISM